MHQRAHHAVERRGDLAVANSERKGRACSGPPDRTTASRLCPGGPRQETAGRRRVAHRGAPCSECGARHPNDHGAGAHASRPGVATVDAHLRSSPSGGRLIRDGARRPPGSSDGRRRAPGHRGLELVPCPCASTAKSKRFQGHLAINRHHEVAHLARPPRATSGSGRSCRAAPRWSPRRASPTKSATRGSRAGEVVAGPMCGVAVGSARGHQPGVPAP